MEKDQNELNLLSVFYFVISGLAAIGACVPIIYLVIGVMMLRDPRGLVGPGAPPINPGWFFMGFGALFTLLGWALTFMLVLSGMSLRQRRRYWLCFVMGCIICLNMPL